MIIEDEYTGAEAVSDYGAGYALLEALKEEGLLTEARSSIITNQIIIAEAAARGTPTQYVHKGRVITWEQFYTVYTDYDRYQTIAAIWLGLGYPEEAFKPENPDAKQTIRDNMAKSLERVLNHFKHYNKEARDLVSPKHRMQKYSKLIPDNREVPKPTIDDIHGGSIARRTPTTAIVDRINQQRLMSGEFYSNATRIQKSHWGNWLRFWEREYSSVHNDHSLFGRVWKKDFVLGYQMEGNLFYEIWYNSIDSTFALHDSTGNQISRRVATLNEAMRALMNAVKQASPQDADFFRGNMNNQVATSLIRSITPGLDSHIEDLQKLDMAQQKRKDEEEARKEEARREADRKRRENMEYFRKKAIDVASVVGKEVERAAIDKAAAMAAQARAEAEAAREREYRQRAGADKAAADQAEQANRRHSAMHDAVRDSMRRAQAAARARAQASPEAAREANEKRWSAEAEMRAREYAKQQAELLRRKRDAERKRRERALKGGSIPALPAPKDLTEQVEYWSPKVDMFGDSEGDINIPTNYERDIEQMRRVASQGADTQDAIKKLVNSEMISTYTTTRVEEAGFVKNRLVRWLNKGRSDSIILPNDSFIWKKVKSYVLGQRYRADFIIGFTLNDAVNIEIWYISEPNPAKGSGFHGGSKTVSSFYVFDVKSGKLLRKFIPYYRNAVQVAMAKLAAV